MPTSFPFYLNIAASVTISDNAGLPVLLVENLDGLGLYMEWDITRMLSTSSDMGSLRIYNLGSVSMNVLDSLVKASKGTPSIGTCTLSLGWAGVAFKVMEGQIWKMQSKVYEDPDVVTNIEFGQGVVSGRDAQTLPTAVAQIFITDLLSLLATRFRPPRLLDVAQVNKAVAASPNGRREMGRMDPTVKPAKQTFDDIVSGLGPGYSWGYGPNGLIVVFDRGLLTIDPSTKPELVSPATGLLSFTEEDNGSVSFDCLANPSVAPGLPVAIVDRDARPVGQPVMRVESVSFTGDTRSDSLMRGVARPLSVI